MFDLHYHLLYGVDDGPKTIEESVAMAEASIAEGTTHIVCTPHLNHRYAFAPEANREALARVEEKLDGRIKIALGCEFHLAFEHMELLERDPQLYAINNQRYILVELSDFGLPPHLEDWFDDIQSFGLTPIIAHPERNPMVQMRANLLEEWAAAGVLFQITAGSLRRRFGNRAEKLAEQLLKKDLVHVVASDAHGSKSRGPSMKKAFDFLSKRYGRATANRLCIANPRSIFFGEPIARSSASSAENRREQVPSLWGRILGMAN